MPAPPKPAPPRLFGSNASQREAARGEQSLRLTWNSVTDANGYNLRFGPSDVRSNTLQGGTFGSLSRNTQYVIRVQAFNDDGASDWSDPTTIYTRPAQPRNLRLAGSFDSRNHNSLEIEWDIAASSPAYDVEVNGTVTASLSLPNPVTLGSPSFVFAPNQRQIIRIRARDNANGGVSFWSDNGGGQDSLDTVTRPNPTLDIGRVRIDMFGHGVRVIWKVDAPAAWSASSVLMREEGGATDRLTAILHAVDGQSDYAFNDLAYRYGSARLYSAKVVIPRASVPGDVLGADNESIGDPQIRVALPISLLPVIAKHGQSRTSATQREDSLSLGTKAQPAFPTLSPWGNSNRES